MRIFKSYPLLSLVNGYLVDSPQPSNISYLWNFGSLLGFCLVIQIITGVTLAMHYNPSVLEAFNSVEHIMRDVNNGWLIRYLHSNTALAFFFLVYLHIGRGLYYGSYRAPRTLVWTIGTVIFILMMATAFLGYVLPYGQMSLWGATVITNLMSAIPWVGQDIVEFIWGGFFVNNATLNRFFALHFVLPFVLAALALMHLIALHDSAGSGNPLGVSGNYDRLPFARYFVFKDLITILSLLQCIMITTLYFFNYDVLLLLEFYLVFLTILAIASGFFILNFGRFIFFNIGTLQMFVFTLSWVLSLQIININDSVALPSIGLVLSRFFLLYVWMSFLHYINYGKLLPISKFFWITIFFILIFLMLGVTIIVFLFIFDLIPLDLVSVKPLYIHDKYGKHGKYGVVPYYELSTHKKLLVPQLIFSKFDLVPSSISYELIPYGKWYTFSWPYVIHALDRHQVPTEVKQIIKDMVREDLLEYGRIKYGRH